MRMLCYLLLCCFCCPLAQAQVAPTVNFTAVLSGNTANFTNTSAALGEGEKRAFWSFGDGTRGVSPAYAGLVHNYATAGTYTVCLKIYRYNTTNASDSTLIGDVCKTVAVAARCEAGFQWLDSVAQNTPAHFLKLFAGVNTNAGNPPVEICWNFGDGSDTCIRATAGMPVPLNVVHRYTKNGTYQVCLRAKFDGGCVAERCNTVVLSGLANECSFDLAEAAMNVASLERKFFVGLMPARTAEKICWNFGDGTDTCVTLNSPLNVQQLMITHRYPAPGNYSICARVTYAGGCTVQRCRPVVISAPRTNLCGGFMTDSIINANTIRFTGAGIQNLTDNVTAYNWSFGDGSSGSGRTLTHTYAAGGKYNVCLLLRTAAGCESKICNTISIAGNSQPQLVLMPNPVTTVINATFISAFQQTLTVRIYNANGLMVRSYTRSASIGTNNWTLTDVATLPTGVYSVIVQSPNQFATAIFSKQ